MTRMSEPPERPEDPSGFDGWLDDAIDWFESECPGWSPYLGPDQDWYAMSPTWSVDGLIVRASDPRELVERIRAVERLLALAAEAWPGAHDNPKRVPVGTIARVNVETSTDRKAALRFRGKVPAPPDLDPTAVGPVEHTETAQYRCNDCGETTGCS
jgi:hypothetical protein